MLVEFFYYWKDVDALHGSSALGDSNPPASGSANPNPPEPATPIKLGASLPPLPPKQVSKDLSIVWQHFIKVAGLDPEKLKSECKYCKNQYNCHGKTNGTLGMLHHMDVCKKWHFSCDDKQKYLSFQAIGKGIGCKL